MEDKRAICEALLPVLQMTKQCGDDLTGLEYSGRLAGGEEHVTAIFRHGQKVIDATADSGIGLIYDIVKKLKN